MERLTREEYYVQVLEAVKRRGTCDRGRGGAIIVLDGRIIATGYVGAPKGFPHCDEVGHDLFMGHCLRTVHAEMNAILQCASYGIPCLGSTMYCTMIPCWRCAMAIVNVGIREVIAVHPYQDKSDSEKILRKAGIGLKCLKPDLLY